MTDTPPRARTWIRSTLYLGALVCAITRPGLASAEPAASANVTAEATPEGGAQDGRPEIHLITIGPGDHLYTAGGHAAVMVAWIDDGEADPNKTLIYNFGDADFDDPDLPLDLVRGGAKFRLTVLGTLQDLVNDYGLRQGRDVWRQKINLTDAQAAQVADSLAHTALPENRDYPHHYHYSTCTTKIRDVLDEATDGALRGALVGAPASPSTSRGMERILFRRHHLMALVSSLFFGRVHDRPVDKWFATVATKSLSDYLQEIQVPAPDGEGTVPLADPPTPLIQYIEPDVVKIPSITTPLVTILAMLLLGFGGRRALRRLPEKTAGAGLWIGSYGLISGLLGLLMLAVMLYSNLDELRYNENALLFPVTDLLLVYLGVLWSRRPLGPGERKLLTAYAGARMGLILLVILLQLLGVFYQEPRIFIAMSGLFSVGLLALARRCRA